MTDAPTQGQELATQTTAPRAVREYRVVENPLGIMDTARFEHLGRVAGVMARAGLMPMSLTHAKAPGARDDDKPLPLDYEVVLARAYLIANQADLFQMDPNALAQCVSIVHGKLMYEGKLVHALISAKLGVDLDYQFGIYNAAKRDVLGEYVDGEWEGQMPTAQDDQALGVRVVGTLPGERKARWIAGSVGMWHKGPKSPWGDARAWPRQLRYMGAREWCRAYKPSLLLGIMTDDEVDEYDLGRQVGAIAPAAPQLVHSGFSDVRTAQLISPEPAPPKRTRGKNKAAEPVTTQENAPHDPETGEILGNEHLATAGAPAAEPAPDTPAIATDASTAGAAEISPSEAQASGSEEVDTISAGFPAPGEIYHLDGDLWLGDGKRDTYKDGKPFSSAGRSAGYAIYDDHAPETQDEEINRAGAEAADSANDAPPLDPEVQAYADAVKAAPDFQTVKAALATLQKTEAWKKMDNAAADEVRFNTWDIMVETGLAAGLHLSEDVSAFRLWIEWCEDPEMIEGQLSKLEDNPEFRAKSDSLKENIRGATKKRLESLAG